MVDLKRAQSCAEELSRQAQAIQDKADSITGVIREINRLEENKARIQNPGTMFALLDGKNTIPLPKLTTSQINAELEKHVADLICSTQTEFEKALCELMGPIVEPAKKKPSKSR